MGKVVKLNPKKEVLTDENGEPLNSTSPKPEEEVVKDPTQYGYKDGVKIEVDANWLMSLTFLTQQVFLKERSITYEPRNSMEDTVKTGKESVTELGLQAMRWTEMLIELHKENIEKGVAVHASELNVPKDFSIDTVETED